MRLNQIKGWFQHHNLLQLAGEITLSPDSRPPNPQWHCRSYSRIVGVLLASGIIHYHIAQKNNCDYIIQIRGYALKEMDAAQTNTRGHL